MPRATSIAVAALLAVGSHCQLGCADEPSRLPDWVVRGVVVALTRGSPHTLMSDGFTGPSLGLAFQQMSLSERDSVTQVEIRHLTDSDGHVREFAMELLSQSATEAGQRKRPVIAALIDGLSDKDSSVRREAAQALADLTKNDRDESSKVIDALIDRLSDNEMRVTTVAALGTLAMGNQDKAAKVVTALTAQLGDADKSVLGAAAEALGDVVGTGRGDVDATINALVPLLGNEDSEVRRAAGKALGTLMNHDQDRAKEFTTRLVNQLDSGDVLKRRSAADALGGFAVSGIYGSEATISTLIAHLGDEDTETRRAVLRGIGELMKDKQRKVNQVVSALINKLEAGDIDERHTAADALGGLETDDSDLANKASAALIGRLGDRDSVLRCLCAEALTNLVRSNRDRSEEVVTMLIKRLDDHMDSAWSDDEWRRTAVETLGNLTIGYAGRSDDVRRVLSARLDDRAPSVRRAAAEALGGLSKYNAQQPNEVITALIAHLGDDSQTVRRAAAEALGGLGSDTNQSNDVFAALIGRLGDSDLRVSRAAAEALGTALKSSRKAPAEVVSALIAQLGSNEKPVRRAAAEALEMMPEPPTVSNLVAFLAVAAETGPADASYMEGAFHIFAGGDERLELLLPLLRFAPAHYDEPDAALVLFANIWPQTTSYRELRQLIAWHAKNISEGMCTEVVPASYRSWVRGTWLEWLVSGTCLDGEARHEIGTLSVLFKQAGIAEGPELDRLLKDDAAHDMTRRGVSWILGGVAAHTAFWIGLLLLYPRFTWAQAVFFWNPRVRKLLGLHLCLLIPVLPFARRQLLEPFRSALGPKPGSAGALAGAGVAWFPESEVTEAERSQRMPIVRALPRVRGLTVLQGASGLGKTVHLVRLARDPKRIVAFIGAGEEGGDVVKAIAARLPAEVMRDEAFLRMLIHARGLDICVDGLNEVSADARAAVAAFAQTATRANILISTQPIRWNCPAGARLLHLQPLRPDQRQDFLESREPMLPAGVPLRGERFKERVRAFVSMMEATTPLDIEERVARDRALSNPMDLTTIAIILANGGAPDLLNLQQTAYLQAAAQYTADNQGAEFPLTAFSDYLYQERCKATGPERELIVLRDQRFAAECDALADHRLLLKTIEPDQNGKDAPAWRFRHDKVLDFFLYVAVTNPQTVKDRIQAHVADPRFRGVYLLLALRAPLQTAKEMRDRLADYATETRDHVLSDEVWGIVRQRLEAAPGTASPYSTVAADPTLAVATTG